MKQASYAFILVFTATLIVASLSPRDAAATTFTVDSTIDAVDFNPGNGICDIDFRPDFIKCTLRGAIQEANALEGSDEIIIPPGTYTLGIIGTDEDNAATGDLDIKSHLTIRSNGPSSASSTIVDGGNIDRVFEISGIFASGSRAEVHFIDFTIAHGRVATAGTGGAGILASYTDLFLDGMIVRDNHVIGTLSGDKGGGLVILSPSNTRITQTTFSGNTADRGGAIFSNTDLSIDQSTFNDNSARAASAIITYGKFDLSNSTISGNVANSTGGAALYVNDTASAPLIRGCTIYDNTDAIMLMGGVRLGSGTDITLLNTIIANNGDKNCSFEDATARFSNGAYNLSNDESCSLTETGDMQNTDPALGPLANNGGRTKTHLPQKASPVIDAGLPAHLIPPGMEVDQRGVKRPQNTRADIGAVEIKPECSFFVIPITTGKNVSFCL